MRSVVEISDLGLRPASGVWTPSDVRVRDSGAEYDDDPITEQAWAGLQPAAPPPPPTAKREEVAKAIYPPPSQYLGVAAYNELVAIAANLGLDEATMVARLGIPVDCPGYLLERPWVFAMVRGLAVIAAGQQPGPPDFSKAVLKFGYRSADGPRLVVVGLDGTLLHGEAAAVANMAQQLRIRCDSSGGPELRPGIRL